MSIYGMAASGANRPFTRKRDLQKTAEFVPVTFLQLYNGPADARLDRFGYRA
jgi:hypothetical protein